MNIPVAVRGISCQKHWLWNVYVQPHFNSVEQFQCRPQVCTCSNVCCRKVRNVWIAIHSNTNTAPIPIQYMHIKFNPKLPTQENILEYYCHLMFERVCLFLLWTNKTTVTLQRACLHMKRCLIIFTAIPRIGKSSCHPLLWWWGFFYFLIIIIILSFNPFLFACKNKSRI